MSRPRNGLRGSFAAAALCVLLAGAISPRAASASCGDWLEGHDRAEARRAVEQATSVPTTDHDGPQRPPCRGPSCSDAPGGPAAPAPEITVPAERWACVADCRADSGPRTSERLPEPPLTLLPRRTSGVFRPPR